MKAIKHVFGIGFLVAAAALTGCYDKNQATTSKVFSCKAKDGSFAHVYQTGEISSHLEIQKRLGLNDQTTYMDKTSSSTAQPTASAVAKYKEQAKNYCDTGTQPSP